jgi:hypothetical protein
MGGKRTFSEPVRGLCHVSSDKSEMQQMHSDEDEADEQNDWHTEAFLSWPRITAQEHGHRYGDKNYTRQDRRES